MACGLTSTLQVCGSLQLHARDGAERMRRRRSSGTSTTLSCRHGLFLVQCGCVVGSVVLDEGNPDCWKELGSSTSAYLCCNLAYGVTGNPVCWTGNATFLRCCTLTRLTKGGRSNRVPSRHGVYKNPGKQSSLIYVWCCCVLALNWFAEFHGVPRSRGSLVSDSTVIC